MGSKIKVLIIVGLAIFSIAVYGYFKAVPGLKNETQARPVIEISPQSFDFGRIKYGQVVKYSFRVKNSGNEILEIQKVATSCSCTTAEVSRDKIAPQQEAELRVVYDSGAMSGSFAKGDQERIIYVKSNDPVSPQAKVMIHGFVE
jgi:hypothetical protein